MNFNQLRYMVAVDSFRSFSKAADFCGIAQSTLSKELQKLEQQYNIIIFDRSRLPVVPTIKGEELIRQAIKILDDYEQFSDIAREKHNTSLSGIFKLGVHTSLAPYLLPLFMPQFAGKHPDLKLVVVEADQKSMHEQLQTGQLDGCIIIQPFYKEGYYETAIFQESFVLYVDEQNPLRTYESIKPEEIPFDDLLVHEDLRKELLFLHKDLSTERISKTKSRQNVTYQSGSLETIRKIIDLHGGVTILPELSCIYMGERRRQLTIPIHSQAFKRTIGFIAPRGFQKNRIIKAMVREIASRVKELLRGA